MRSAVVGGIVVVAAIARAQMRPPEPRAVRVAASAAAIQAIERGRRVYGRYGCAQCHGTDATGGFANRNSETDGKVPGLQFVKEGYTPSELRRKILDGAPTIGKGDSNGPTPPYRMPGWAGQMTDNEVADLVQYLISLYPNTAEDKWR